MESHREHNNYTEVQSTTNNLQFGYKDMMIWIWKCEL